MKHEDYLKNKKQVLEDLNCFIKWHLDYQSKALMLANQANLIGMDGFSTFYQVEAADALAHLRRIINYMTQIDVPFKIDTSNINDDYKNLNVCQLLQKLIDIKCEGLALANKFSKNACACDDYLTKRFYEWYLIDFAHEIDENRQTLEYISKYPTSIPRIDQEAGSASEPDIDIVKKPFSINKI